MRSKTNTGITAIEILIVVAIIVILVSLSFTSLLNLNKSEALDKSAMLAVSVLDQARSLTLASKNDTRYGIHFASSTVTLFTGTSYLSGDSSNQVNNINKEVEIKAINLSGGGSDVIFDRLTGATSQNGVVTFGLKTGNMATRTVTIYKTGIAQ